MGILTYTCICINRVVTPVGLKDMEDLQKLSLIVMEKLRPKFKLSSQQKMLRGVYYYKLQ